MKVTLIQFSPRLENPTANLERIQELLEDARESDLVVLPELASSGYAFGSREQALAAGEDLGDSHFLRALQEFCAAARAHVVTGICEREGERIFNSAVVLGSDGIRGVYRKLHLFDREKLWFTPGDAVAPLVDVGGARVGMAICFDWMFPEIWRLLALRGADLIAHPSNLVIPGNCQRAVPVHALINRVFIATANRIGSEGDLDFTGRSLLVDPRGRLLCEGSADREEVLGAALDPSQARDKRITGRNVIPDDRRPEAYGELCQPGEGPA